MKQWHTAYESTDYATGRRDIANFPTEFLNSLRVLKLPSHIRNSKCQLYHFEISISQSYAYARLVVNKSMNNLIEATVLFGRHDNEDALISWIPLIPTVRVQTTFDLQYATRSLWKKTRGQYLRVCGSNSENECFSRGNL